MRPDHDWPDLSDDDDIGNGYFAKNTIAWDCVYERALTAERRTGYAQIIVESGHARYRLIDMRSAKSFA